MRGLLGLVACLFVIGCGDDGDFLRGEFVFSAEIVSFLDPDGASIAVAEDGAFDGKEWRQTGECQGQLTSDEIDSLVGALRARS